MYHHNLILALTLSVAVTAAPIRVGIFNGVGGSGTLWHESTHAASVAIGGMLAAPDATNLGPDPVIYSDGFSYTSFGVRVEGFQPNVEGKTPGAEAKAFFLAALDTLDVVVFIHNTNLAFIFEDSTARARLADFWKRKGVVSIHATADTPGEWAQWDSLHGTSFSNHPLPDRTGTLRRDTTSRMEPAWNFLNKGLSDTSFVEEWFYFTTSGASIRAVPGLEVTVNLDESSLEGTGLPEAMGDHPMSWYREFPEGGRFFYTAMGHRPNLWNAADNQPRFVRRQVYNAILWAAGVDSTGTVSLAPRTQDAGPDISDHARLSFRGGSLTISLVRDEPATVEVRNLKGRLLTSRRIVRKGTHIFPGIQSGIHFVIVKTSTSRVTTKILMP